MLGIEYPVKHYKSSKLNDRARQYMQTIPPSEPKRGKNNAKYRNRQIGKEHKISYYLLKEINFRLG